ncbi:hypothetical protein [Culturomica massiliensis]|uniref:hypothetical protein n=1 Tax=Culturomica massiliensis TaxID=1841857 RepID=UPI002670B69E|nr:hypothetical protein [Culturomica massiliensis]
MSLKKIISGISTFPSKNAWVWKDSVSVLSFTLFHLLWIIRLFSLLQIIKYIYRKIAFCIKQFSLDKGSKRINIPVLLVELYFIFFALGIFFVFRNKYILFYYLIESSVWLLYYNVFRRFYEEKYSICHQMEYFVLIPVVFFSQAKAISLIENADLNITLQALAGNFPSADFPFYVTILSVLYIAIIISVVISTLPSESVKTEKRSHFMTIIGAGDVVCKRLYPALQRLCPYRDIVIFHKKNTPVNPDFFTTVKSGLRLFEDDFEIAATARDSEILWIATPSYKHLPYLESFMNDSMFIVLEKPLTSVKYEIPLLKKLMAIPSIWNKIFSLSYYVQEKALPLTYFFNPLSFYEKYLTFPELLNKKMLAEIRERLGKIKDVGIFLVEGKDARDWANDSATGGQLFETFIHPALINRIISGEEAVWTDVKWSLGVYEDIKTETFIGCKGKTNGYCFTLLVGKFINDLFRKRYCEVRFENGVVFMDFDERMLKIQTGEESYSIAVSSSFRNYEIQTDMVVRCYEDHLVPSIVDCSGLQVGVLEWLSGQDLTNVTRFNYSDDFNPFAGMKQYI